MPPTLARIARFGEQDRRRLTYGAIALGIGATLLLSMDDSNVRVEFRWIAIALYASIAFFWWEWLIRLTAAVCADGPGSYLWSGQGVIDTASAVAIPLAQLCGIGLRSAALFTAIWLLKPVPRIAGLRPLRRVIRNESGALISVLVLFLIVLFTAAVLVYVFERNAQPQAFGSLPAALWWAVVTLTTTGYGDVVPVTAPGRMVAALLMICGLGVFGLWTGILANGFAAETRRHNSIQTWDSLSKVPFFAALSPAVLADVAHVLRRVDLRARTIVLRKGEPGDCMYFVASGAVVVERAGKTIPLGVGSFFGELALLGNHMRSADVTTTAPSTLLVLDLIDFRGLMARHPELARAIDDEAARRADENRAVT